MRVLGVCPRLALVVGAVLWVVSAGCWSPRAVRPLESPESLDLAPDEGLIAVEIQSEIPLAAFRFSGATVASDLPPGDHLLLLAVKRGRYRWNELDLRARSGDILRWRLLADDLLEFHVDSGRVNYLGCFRFEGESREGYVVSWRGSWTNRSAQVVARLNQAYPGLLRRYPPIFGGAFRDDYLERYGQVLGDRPTAPATKGAP